MADGGFIADRFDEGCFRPLPGTYLVRFAGAGCAAGPPDAIPGLCIDAVGLAVARFYRF